MKKTLLTLMACVVLGAAGIGQSNLPNGDMEGWHDVTLGTVTFTQIDGPMFNTLNELAAVPPPMGPGPITVDKTSDSHTGSWAAKLHSEIFPMIPSDIFIPGMMGFTQLDMLNNGIKLGKPCPGCKPIKFYGWYKFEQVNGDSCAAILLASKWNTTLNKKDTIGYCRTDFRTPQSTWTYFEMPVTYTGSDTPDSLLILMVSSGGFNPINFQGAVGQVGNTMYVDDISIDYPLGVTQVLMPEIGVKTYPNPAKDQMTVEITRSVPGGMLDIYNMEGKLVSSQKLERTVTTINVSGLAPGQYHYKLIDGKTIQNTGFFMIRK
jgi:hypothetical protein